MWSINPFEKHISALLLLMIFISCYISVRKNNNRDVCANFTTFQIKTYLKKTSINVLGLFEVTTKWGVRREADSEISAARLAIKHINELGVIEGFTLQLLLNDTMCDPGVGVDRFFHALYSKKTVSVLLGSACSNVTESIANIVPYWNILQVSFGSTSPALSDRKKFPLFFRTVAPDSSHNAARISFIKHFGWKTVATLSDSQDTHLLSSNNFVTELEKENVICTATITFSSDNFKEQLKDLDTRIIVGSFSPAMAVKIFCEAYLLGMYGADYVWIIQDHNIIWWNNFSGCNYQHIKQATNGLILISNHNFVTGSSTSLSGLTKETFQDALNLSHNIISKYASQTYDAVWSVALALRDAQNFNRDNFSLADFNYQRNDMASEFVYRMGLLNFKGISGHVKFDGADRIGNSIFKQIQGDNMQHVALYHSQTNILDFNCNDCQKIQWKNDQIPIAQKTLKFRLIKVPKLFFYAILTFSMIGIFISIIFLYLNFHFRWMKTVKLSSPRLNNIAVFGCIVVYISVILLDLDQDILPEKYYSGLCSLKVYLFSSGFSLTFGSILAKTYRIHRIFTYSRVPLVRDKLLKDKQLIAMIFCLLFVDCTIVTLWTTIDPMKRQLHNLSLEINVSDRGVVYQPQIEICRSENTVGWCIAIYTYKSFLLIMGAYMAWETRHIKIPALNDSRYIGICVYSALSSAIIAVFSNFLTEYTTLSYLASTLSILSSTTVSLLLLFFPKLKTVLRRTNSDDAIVQSLGLKIQCNTRRFAENDSRELIYRLEVKNKVYRCELIALEREIARLEDILANAPSCSVKSSKPYIVSDFLGNFTVGRASWPSTVRDSTKTAPFFSENKLHADENFFDGLKIFDRIRRFFGSNVSISNGDEKTPHSNSDFYLHSSKQNSHQFLKVKSAANIAKRSLFPIRMEERDVNKFA